MRLNDDEASGREGLQRGEETMCQTAGGGGGEGVPPEASLIETLSLAQKSCSHHLQNPQLDMYNSETPESQVTIIM